MILALLAGVLFLMWLQPELPLSRALHRILVELPIMWSAKLERHHLICLVILCALMFSSALSGAILGSAELAFAYALDVSLYVDALIATSAVAATTNLKAAARALRSRLRRVLPAIAPDRRAKARSKRSKARRARKVPANDADRICSVGMMAA